MNLTSTPARIKMYNMNSDPYAALFYSDQNIAEIHEMCVKLGIGKQSDPDVLIVMQRIYVGAPGVSLYHSPASQEVILHIRKLNSAVLASLDSRVRHERHHQAIFVRNMQNPNKVQDNPILHSRGKGSILF